MGIIKLKSSKIGIENYYDWISILNSYKKYVKKTDIVLEIGASYVPKTRNLSKYCKKIIGIELLPERLPKNFDNVEYLIGDWQKLTKVVNKESINICIATHVIEHLPNDLKAINQLYEVLVPGGIALISTPNKKRLARILIDLLSGKNNLSSGEHFREYTKEDLESLLENSRFKKYKIFPVAVGFVNGPFLLYSTYVPNIFCKFASFWEIHLFK